MKKTIVILGEKNKIYTVFLFISLLVLCGCYTRMVFGKPGDINEHIGMSEMVTVVRCCR